MHRPGKLYFEIELAMVEDYVRFQFTCTDPDLATLTVPDPDLGLVSSADSSLFALGRTAKSLKTVLQ